MFSCVESNPREARRDAANKVTTMKKLLIALIVAAGLAGCTANQMAREFGGTMTVRIPADQQFVDVPWKETTLWYITKPRELNHAATRYAFKADSAFGIFEGTVNFVEDVR